MKSTRTRTLVLVPALLLGAALSGCSEDAPAAADPVVASTSAAPDPLPLTDHVLTDLAGFEAGEAELLDAAGFAQAHDKKVADLEEAGMVAAASVQLEPSSGPGMAMSIAQQFEEVAQAETEADRLFAANAEGDPGTTVTPLEVPGIPGAQAITMAASQGKQELAAVEIVFVTEAVVHEVFAFGTAEGLDVADVVARATALYEGVAGRPVA